MSIIIMRCFSLNRLVFISIAAAAVSLIIAVRLAVIVNDNEIISVSDNIGTYTVKSMRSYAYIYDCNMKPLVNCSDKYSAVIIPNNISAIQLQPFILDKETYYDGISKNMPFLCEVTNDVVESGIDAVFFRTKVRNDSNQLAPHIIGYSLENTGFCGIEKSYNDFLKNNSSVNSVTFQVDARGEVLNGLDYYADLSPDTCAGVITTIDSNIQKICEDTFTEQKIECGAIIVMDVKTGEIRASVSYPDFDITNLSESIDSENSPFLNRAFSSYSLGSIFKLVTAAAALEQGISNEFSYTCMGSIDVNGQIFNCHKWGGHGEIDMNEAIVQSCNTYFIALSEYLDNEKYIETASDLGFGEETVLCNDIISASGNLQTLVDICVPAEKANMSFGQGKLLATPLQVCRMTAAIANDGVINTPTLIKGIKYEDGSIEYNNIISGKRVLSYKTVKALNLFMLKTVRAENSMSNPDKTVAAGKTSTAQTGWYNSNGNELYNCWFTGYFPSYKPRYAVTVLVENGVSGNRNAGPVFKEIADKITEYEKSLRKK